MTDVVFLTENFSLQEAEHSQTASRLGIDNRIPRALIPAVTTTARNMERVRALLQAPIHINSWYRGQELQKLPEFKNPTSQHALGEAVDFICPAFGSSAAICRKLIKYPELLKFDQLILEHSWIHISFKASDGAVQRNQVLSLLANKKYAVGLTDVQGVPI